MPFFTSHIFVFLDHHFFEKIESNTSWADVNLNEGIPSFDINKHEIKQIFALQTKEPPNH